MKMIEELSNKQLEPPPKPSKGAWRQFTNAFSTTIFMSLVSIILSLIEYSAALRLFYLFVTGTNLGVIMPLLFGLFWFVKKCLNLNVSNFRQMGECAFALLLLSIALGNSDTLVSINKWLYEKLTNVLSEENLLNIKKYLNDTIGGFFTEILTWINRAYYYTISWIPLGPPVNWNNLNPYIDWDEWGMYNYYDALKKQFTAFDDQFKFINDSINEILVYIKSLKDMASMPDAEEAKEAFRNAGRKAGEKLNDAAINLKDGIAWVSRGAMGLLGAGNQAMNQANQYLIEPGEGWTDPEVFNNRNTNLLGGRRFNYSKKDLRRNSRRGNRRRHRRRNGLNLSHIQRSKKQKQLQKILYKSKQQNKRSKKDLNINYEDIDLDAFAKNINSIRSNAFIVIGMLLNLDMIEHSYKQLDFNKFDLWQKIRTECMNLLKSLNKVHLMLNKNTDPELENGLINLYETYRFMQFNKNELSNLFNLRALRNGRQFVHAETKDVIPFTFTFMETNNLNEKIILRKYPLVLKPPQKLSMGISKNKSRKNKSRKNKSRKNK